MRSRMDKSSDSRTTTVASTVSAGKDVTLTAQTGDVAVQAATVDAGGSLTLSAAQGGVQILTARDSTAHSEDHSSTGMVWQSRKGSGKVDETTRYAALTAGGGITITAAKGVTAEIHTGGASLADTVAALAQKPDTAWIAQVAKRDDVTWKRVQEIHDAWDYKSQGLSGPASVVIAIAVAIATQGAGAGLLGAALGEGALTGAVALVARPPTPHCACPAQTAPEFPGPVAKPPTGPTPPAGGGNHSAPCQGSHPPAPWRV
jgi:filamentous hemagglutinin